MRAPSEHTEIPSETLLKWQEIVNVLAEVMHVPAALVMQVEPPNIKVFVSSELLSPTKSTLSVFRPREEDCLSCARGHLLSHTIPDGRILQSLAPRLERHALQQIAEATTVGKESVWPGHEVDETGADLMLVRQPPTFH